MRVRSAMVMLAGFAVAGCGDGSTPLLASAGSPQGMWEVVEVDGEPVEIGVNTSSPAYLEIDGGRIEGDLGCNRGGGNIVVRDDRLLIDEFFATAAGCMPDRLMTVELAIGSAIGTTSYRVSGSRMIWTGEHEIVFERVDSPPTTTWPEPARVNANDVLDCGDDWVEEILRVAHEGRSPLEVAVSFDDTVVDAPSVGPLMWQGLDADGFVRVVVFEHDDATGDFQVLHCVS